MNKQKTRHKKIIELLESKNELDVNQACDIFNVSPATIRRDFSNLLNNKEIRKTWGGLTMASKSESQDKMSSIARRQLLYSTEKQKIAQKAASFVKDGDVIIIDGGTTTYFMIPYLAKKNIKVITNSILIAYYMDKDRLNKFGGAEIFLTGGFIYPNSELLVGPQAIANIKLYHANCAFLSVGGLELDLATNSNQLVVETERAMIEQCEKVIILADSSKFGKKSMNKMCDLKEVDVLITNHDKKNADMIEEMKRLGTNIIEVV